MSEPIIRVENLGKKYLIRHKAGGERYRALRDVLAIGVKTGFGLFNRQGRGGTSTEEFWALKDVSFEVNEGNVVGIIGRNGAGKSTLLKVLSRITEPTTGRVTLNGRVASLLEVGTGFHPELSGRENIYLNGTILGMRRAEIARKFDEIVAFAEVEKFLDTPVKRYSSGMYVRLAFAVAAHLEPEILVVDEVLAVGDAEFQKKCLGKMSEVAAGGRTVLFVSHNMNAVEELCSRAVLLQSGQVVSDDRDVRGVVVDYLRHAGDGEVVEWRNQGGEHANPYFTPTRFYVGDEDGKVASLPVRNDAVVYVYIEGEVAELEPTLKVGYWLYTATGQLLYWSLHTDGPQDEWPCVRPGTNRFRSQLPTRLLNEGEYRLELDLSLHFRQVMCEPGVNAPSLRYAVQGGLSESPYWMTCRPGLLAPLLPWAALPPDYLRPHA